VAKIRRQDSPPVSGKTQPVSVLSGKKDRKAGDKPETAGEREQDLKRRMAEYIEELKKNPPGDDGNIDVDTSSRKGPVRSDWKPPREGESGVGYGYGKDEDANESRKRIADSRKDSLIRLLDNLMEILLLKGVKPRQLNRPTIQHFPTDENNGA